MRAARSCYTSNIQIMRPCPPFRDDPMQAERDREARQRAAAQAEVRCCEMLTGFAGQPCFCCCVS